MIFDVTQRRDELQIYNRLISNRVTKEDLKKNDFPRRDPHKPKLRMPPINKYTGQRKTLKDMFSPSYTCFRCKKAYPVRENGQPAPEVACSYHLGNCSKKGKCTSCNAEWTAQGCVSKLHHVHRGEGLLANYMGYKETQGQQDKLKICALDCEMAYTIYGLELTRVSVVNFLGDVVYDELVRPNNRVLDYNTEYSGITKADLEGVRTSLRKVQRDLFGLISNQTIIIGHGLEHDMTALKLFHKMFIDTSLLYNDKGSRARKPSLKALMLEVFGRNIQEGNGHDSREDARAALCLALHKIE